MAETKARTPTQVRMNESEKKKFTRAAAREGELMGTGPMGLSTWLRYLAEKRIKEMDEQKSRAA